jgi:hypothetical protein
MRTKLFLPPAVFAGLVAAAAAPLHAQKTVVAERVAPAPAVTSRLSTTPTVGYDDGFFVTSDDRRFALTIQGRVQGRYEQESIETSDGRDTQNAFSIARARLILKGHAYSTDIRYKFETDFGKGGVALKDFLIDYQLGRGVWVRAGQWKRPFSRQQINSSGNLELVDRAITDKAFGAGRDIGVALHNRYERSPRFEWAIGVFNGTGDKANLSGDVQVDMRTGEGEIIGGGLSNVPSHVRPTAVGRIGYNHGGIAGYSEADLEGGPLRFGVAASALTEYDSETGDESAVKGELDYVVKAHGFSTTGGIYLATAQDGAGFTDQRFSAVGFHAQLGYMLGSMYQPVLRYARVDRWANRADATGEQEITGGVSVYSFAHDFQWQTDASALWFDEPMAEQKNDYRLRTQLQLAW